MGIWSDYMKNSNDCESRITRVVAERDDLSARLTEHTEMLAKLREMHLGVVAQNTRLSVDLTFADNLAKCMNETHMYHARPGAYNSITAALKAYNDRRWPEDNI